MRLSTFLLATLLCTTHASAQNPPSQKDPADSKVEKASVSGTVLRKGTDEPIPFARITFQKDADDDSASAIHATTGADGKFSRSDLVPGQYQVSVSHAGFVSTSYGAREPNDPGLPLALSAGQHLTDLLFRLIPTGLITGRVRDENGELLPAADVTAFLTSFSGGKPNLVPVTSATTNDLGEYRLFNLPPGKYFVSASLQSTSTAKFKRRMVTIQDGSTDGRGLVTTYYPNAVDLAQAQALNVTSGGELRSIDFLLQAAGTFHVRGHVSGLAPPDPKRGGFAGNILLRRTGARAFLSNFEKTAMLNVKDASFDLSEVASGQYEIIAMEYSENRLRTAHQNVDVGGADVDGVNLVFEPTVTITGHIAWDDKSTLTKPLTVSLLSDEQIFSGSSSAQTQADGSFELKNASADTYSIGVNGDAPDAYLKEARYGAYNALETFHAVPGPSLELIMSNHGAHVQGTVMNSDSISLGNVWVALIPENPNRKQKRLYQSVRTSAGGKFEFRGIAPGDYKLFSWESIDEGEWLDPVRLKEFEPKGTPITVRESENKSVDLTAIPKSPDENQ